MKIFRNILLIGFTALIMFQTGNIKCQTVNSYDYQKIDIKPIELPVPDRPEGVTDVLGLACEPIPLVRVGIIGLGMRGYMAVDRFRYIEGAEIVALCDLYPERVEQSEELWHKVRDNKVYGYSGQYGWREVCERNDVDLVYICTPWDSHVEMALYAMEKGKHVALEVPAAMTVEGCWQLVDMAEKTRKHCIMLENCCYDFFELATLNMAQNGVFGEIMHVEGAYIHDLRDLQFLPEKDGGYQGKWRINHNAVHTGNPYPTHGLGPVCQILDIHRGDKMEYLVSMSTKQKGITEYTTEKYGENSAEAKRHYELGDMNNTIIYTNKGKTILIQHDITSPRPYNRLHTISGTKGFAQKYPIKQIALEPNAHKRLNDSTMNALLEKWEHPFVSEIGNKAKEVGGHGGMDFIMDYRLIYCLNKGLPLDQDVYDAAEWSCIVELSEISARNYSVPVAIPDFTRGAWNKLKGYKQHH
ncbi:MAG: Gfo/Idh/MocA family oxidoreductase [Lentimicrobiaceae bacterium]|nr:Gfo/Idh/MocA family oxidoreductase [Lentimicrobiaceae bacterium]